MIEDWIISKIEAFKPAPLIIVRDPGRIIRPGARAVDGWAEENGYTVFFCTGNLGLRDMYETVRDDPDLRTLLIDRSREPHQRPVGSAGGQLPLFYPDLEVRAGRNQVRLSLRDFLIDQTHDPGWPLLVENRNLTELLRDNLAESLRAHGELRGVHEGRFGDTDLYKIVLGAVLKVNPFRKLSTADVRRICIEQHGVLENLGRILPQEVMETLHTAIRKADKPFCYLLERDPELVVRAFTLAAIMHQHGLDYKLLLPSLAPELHEFRDIDPKFLNKALSDQLKANPDQVSEDISQTELFLSEDPQKLAFLLRDQLQLDDPTQALEVLRRERLSPLIRSLAITSLLFDVIGSKSLELHQTALKVLDEQDEKSFLLHRTAEKTIQIERAYVRAVEVRELVQALRAHAKKLKVLSADQLTFEMFDGLWNGDPDSEEPVALNRLDYYLCDLDRVLRNTSGILPIAMNRTWDELQTRWESARENFTRMEEGCDLALDEVNRKFQDLYLRNYITWIKRTDSPVIFTHQFLSRVFMTHWKPNSGRKAIILIFDGLRVDAWEELVRPVFEERFEETGRFPGSALLPTETQLTRKAISAGCLPDKFTTPPAEDRLLQNWLRQNLPQFKVNFEVKVDDDQKAAGMSFRAVSDQIELIVFKFTDENLHHNTSDLAFIYNNTVASLIRDDVRSLLRELPDDAMLFITSDHGFTPTPAQDVVIPSSLVADDKDIKYRNARVKSALSGADAANTIDFDATKLGISTESPFKRGQKFWHLLFPRPGYRFQRSAGKYQPDRYTHGGLSLAECMIPMFVMTEKKALERPLRIDSLHQVGASLEGEPVALEIVVVAMQAISREVSLELTFSRSEIPARRETFTGEKNTYRVEWKPIIPEENRGEEAIHQSVTVTLNYRYKGQVIRVSRNTEVRIKLDPARLRRRVDSKLDLIMGKVPQGLK